MKCLKAYLRYVQSLPQYKTETPEHRIYSLAFSHTINPTELCHPY